MTIYCGALMTRQRLTRWFALAFASALAAIAVFAAAAGAADDPAEQAPFGGQLPPRLTKPASQTVPPSGFSVSAAEAIEIADRTAAVREELSESPGAQPTAYLRGDRWQISYGDRGAEVALVIVDGDDGSVDEAWRDFQVETPLARGYEGAIAQQVNSPWIWLPLCLLFVAPFFDPRRPLRLLHLDLFVLLGLGISLYFFNRAEITASVALTYPVLGYFIIRLLVAGLWPRERDGPLVPLAPVRWLAIGVLVLAAGRIALNLIDSHVIDIGVAGVIGADRIVDGEPLYRGRLLGRARPQGRRLRTGELPLLRSLRARVPVGWGLGCECRRRPRRGDLLRPLLRRRAGRARPPAARGRRRGGRWAGRWPSPGSRARGRSTR